MYIMATYNIGDHSIRILSYVTDDENIVNSSNNETIRNILIN